MTETKNQKPRKWFYAADALDKMIDRGMDPASAQAALVAALRLGKIRSRARRHWRSKIENINDAWRRPQEPINTKKSLKKSFWRPLNNVAEDKQIWRWRTSCFHTTIKSRPFTRRMMEGVQFRVEDLQIIFPIEFGKAPKARKHGPSPDIERRDKAWLAVVKLGFDDKLSCNRFKNVTGLKSEMAMKALISSGPNGDVYEVGAKKIAEIAKKVWSTLEAAENANTDENEPTPLSPFQTLP
jgi:hypothetical protein